MKTICNSVAGAVATRKGRATKKKSEKSKMTLGRWATHVFSVKPTNDSAGYEQAPGWQTKNGRTTKITSQTVNIHQSL